MSLALKAAYSPKLATLLPTQASPRCLRNRRSLTVFNNGDCEDRSAAALGALELPHGVLWWQNKQHSVYKRDVLHGQDFTLQRQQSGGPGLVLSQRLSSVQLVDKTERERVQIAMYKSAHEQTGLQLAVSDMFTFDLTDYSLLEESEPADDTHHTGFPPTGCTGIVLHSGGHQHKQQVYAFCLRANPTLCSQVALASQAGEQVLTSHSRRTKAVSTCQCIH